MTVRRTVSQPFAHEGVGVHTGAPARARIAPAPWGVGILFRCAGGDVPAEPGSVVDAGGATALGRGAARVRTVEHLLAALWGAGVTDALVEVDGPELPILDGSALPWADGIARVGLVDGPGIAPLVVRAPIEVAGHGGVARAWPAEGCEVAVDVDFGAPGLPRGVASVAIGGDAFRREVAWARTFVIASEIAAARAAGRGRGATPENTVVFGSEGPRTPLRAPDEAVRHKLLDAIGDLALIGRPLLGRIEVVRGGHALHHALVRALRESG